MLKYIPTIPFLAIVHVVFSVKVGITTHTINIKELLLLKKDATVLLIIRKFQIIC